MPVLSALWRKRTDSTLHPFQIRLMKQISGPGFRILVLDERSKSGAAKSSGLRCVGKRSFLRRRLALYPFTPKAGANGALAAAHSKTWFWLAGTKSSGARTKIPVPRPSDCAQGRLCSALFSFSRFPSAGALGSIIPPCGLQSCLGSPPVCVCLFCVCLFQQPGTLSSFALDSLSQIA